MSEKEDYNKSEVNGESDAEQSDFSVSEEGEPGVKMDTGVVSADNAEFDDSEDNVLEDNVLEDNVSEDEVLEDEVLEDEVLEDEVLEDEDGLEMCGNDSFAMPLVQVVEAILFAADEALSIEKIAKAAGKRIRREAVVEAIEELRACYQDSDRAFEIVEIAEKFQMLTRAEFAGNIQALYGKRAIKEEKDKKISPAVLDTLAIIAYKQPVTRAEVEAVRGVGCGQVMRQLMERGSIRPVGKKMDVIGYPLLYGTTDFFLEEFGLASLDVLPMAAELRRLTKVELPVPEVVEGSGSAAGEEVESKLEGAVVLKGADAQGNEESEEQDIALAEDTAEDIGDASEMVDNGRSDESNKDGEVIDLG